MENEKCYSLDGEHYEELDGVLSTLESEHELGTEITIYEGVMRKIDHSEFVYPNRVIDGMMECAYDEMGDFADRYLVDLINDRDTLTNLKKLIGEWVQSQVGDVPFYAVKDVKEIDVVVGE
jgi:hypothetical protein